MNLYRFHGTCFSMTDSIGPNYKIVRTVDNGMYAEIETSSLRKALSIIKSILCCDYFLSATYVVTNSAGRFSARTLDIKYRTNTY